MASATDAANIVVPESAFSRIDDFKKHIIGDVLLPKMMIHRFANWGSGWWAILLIA